MPIMLDHRSRLVTRMSLSARFLAQPSENDPPWSQKRAANTQFHGRTSKKITIITILIIANNK